MVALATPAAVPEAPMMERLVCWVLGCDADPFAAPYECSRCGASGPKGNGKVVFLGWFWWIG